MVIAATAVVAVVLLLGEVVVIAVIAAMTTTKALMITMVAITTTVVAVLELLHGSKPHRSNRLPTPRILATPVMLHLAWALPQLPLEWVLPARLAWGHHLDCLATLTR